VCRSRNNVKKKLRRSIQLNNFSVVGLTPKSALGDFYRRMRAKLGAPKAITAAAHKLARIIFHLISTRQEFDDSKFAADQIRHQKRQEIKLRAKAKSMGFERIPLQPAA